MKSFSALAFVYFAMLSFTPALGHGSAASPESRVLRVFNSNPENPNFGLAQTAVEMDGKSSYYTWNQISQNIPQAVDAGLPAGFDYSPWVPDGHLASGGRFDGNVTGLYYEGLDQISGDWPTTPATAGGALAVDFHATAVHEPSVWDVWMTTEGWTPDTALNWNQMEFLGRPQAMLEGNRYYFDVDIPTDRSGHHVLWIAWQRDDPVGEVFFSTSDLLIAPAAAIDGDYNDDGVVNVADYTVWRDNLGGEATLPNDPTPGAVTTADYELWKTNFGQSAAAANGSISVPEPASIAALGFMLMVGLVYRRLDGVA